METQMELLTAKVNGEGDSVVDRVIYLGVTLDSKLSWIPHITEKSSKVNRCLLLCRKAVGQTWGLSPKVMMWIYQTMIRPIVSYAVTVWAAEPEADLLASKGLHVCVLGLSWYTHCRRRDASRFTSSTPFLERSSGDRSLPAKTNGSLEGWFYQGHFDSSESRELVQQKFQRLTCLSLPWGPL